MTGECAQPPFTVNSSTAAIQVHRRRRNLSPIAKDYPQLLRVIGAAAAIFAGLTQSGCVSAKYKRAPGDTPPPTPLNFAATPVDGAATVTPPIDATLNTVIVFQGPGSWKRDAYWDEYVFSVVNRGSETVVIESARLTDFRGDAVAPASHPWTLEAQSRSRRDELNRLTKNGLIHLGSGYPVLGGSGATAFPGDVASSVAGASVGLALFPAYVIGTVFLNINGRQEIETEFTRRRIALPAILPPGGRIAGSLFFRIAPGPQHLALQCRVGGESREVAFSLTPLSGLHLNPIAQP